MQMLEKSEDEFIKTKFINTTYVLIASMTLMSFIKLIKEEYDRDMHIKTLVHVATEKKVCDIEKHFEIMTLEFNLIDKSTAIVKKTASNKMLNEKLNKKTEVLNNETSKKNEVLIDQALTKEKEMKKTSQSITNSESIIHGKSGTKSHIMKLNQSDEKQQNLSLNNSHSSRQIESVSGEDHFIKASNLENDGLKKQAKSVAKIHHKNSNRIERA
jgi:hypothetical protein